MTTLQTPFLEARFADGTGQLCHLSLPAGPDFLKSPCHCRFHLDGQWYSDGPTDEPAEPLETVSVSAIGTTVESVLRHDSLEITRRFELSADSPLLRVRHSIRSLGGAIRLGRVAFPRMQFIDSFNDSMEDEEDLYFDGEELGDGNELPPWRVFFRDGYHDGIIAAARCKKEMSRFQIYERGFDIRPHVMTAYDTAVKMVHADMELDGSREYTADFELGPWTRESHTEILATAGLEEPVPMNHPPATGEPLPAPDGVVFDMFDFADTPAVSDVFSRNHWLQVNLPCCLGGRALYAGPSVTPADLTLQPNLSGVHRIIVGIGNGAGIVARLSGWDYPLIRTPASHETPTPFHLLLTGPQEAREAIIGETDMSGKTLTLSRFPNAFASTVIDYVRFEPLEKAADTLKQIAPPRIPLSGFCDIPDISRFTDARDPDPDAYRANLWEHANAGISKVFWRIDGQCSDFPCTTNTMRYISARVHGVFHPRSKAYGRVIKKVDILELAVATAHHYGLKLYGWMRFNNYTSNVQSEFFRNHPEFHEAQESGTPQAKLCLAHEAVRRHKIDILIEAAAYGLDGLCLGFLRHPPILHYAPILVEGYTKTYGEPPPSDEASKDPHFIQSLPIMDETHQQWYRYRAQFMTMFGRELKAALCEKGLEHLAIAIWVRPNHCLFDGIDLDTWLDDGLCDEVVADDYVQPEVCRVGPEWKQRVQQKAELIRGIPFGDVDRAHTMINEILENGYDGICTYESDYTVLDSAYRELYESLRE